MIQSGLRKFVAAHTKLPHHSFQYYFFAKSDLDFSIDFFSYLFCIFQIILLPNIMFYPIITTLDGGGGQGRNKQKRYTHTQRTFLLYIDTPACGKQQKLDRVRKNCEKCLKIGEDGKAGKDYKGKVSTTISGKKCQKWSEQTPHTHKWGNEGNHNFCRNIDNHKGVWCYTTDPKVPWEHCRVPKC